MLACRKRDYRAGSRSNAEQRICVIDATQAEYDRFGGVGIPMAGNQNPNKVVLPQHPTQVLLRAANVLRCGASRVSPARATFEFGLGAVAVLVGWGVVRSGIHVQ